MTSRYKLEELHDQGSLEVGVLEGAEKLVGREPESGITIKNEAISRTHGIFIPVRSHWFYRDLGSTNGSWINGRLVRAGDFRIVRPGDVLQLADSAIRISEAKDSISRTQAVAGADSSTARSLVVFVDEHFSEEYLVPEVGKALMVGGSQADLSLEGDTREAPSLTIENSNDRVMAIRGDREVPAYINDRQLTDSVGLVDGDLIKIGRFSIVFIDSAKSRAKSSLGSPPDRPNVVGEISGFRSIHGQALGGVSLGGEIKTSSKTSEHERPSARSSFGRPPAEEGSDPKATVAIDQSRVREILSGVDRHPGSRHIQRGGGQGSSGTPLSPTERKLIGIIVVLLFLGLAFFVVWMIFL